MSIECMEGPYVNTKHPSSILHWLNFDRWCTFTHCVISKNWTDWPAGNHVHWLGVLESVRQCSLFFQQHRRHQQNYSVYPETFTSMVTTQEEMTRENSVCRVEDVVNGAAESGGCTPLVHWLHAAPSLSWVLLFYIKFKSCVSLVREANMVSLISHSIWIAGYCRY